MYKIYLYKVRFEKSLQELYKEFKNTQNSTFSFQPISINNSQLEMVVFEKTKSKVKIVSPIEESFLEYENYNKIHFSIFYLNNSIYFALHNPPRSIRKFINHLSKLLDNHFYMEVVDFNLEKLATLFLENYNGSISCVEFDKISLTQTSYANIEVNSSKNALEDFYKNTLKQNIFIDNSSKNLIFHKITISFKSLFGEQKVIFKKNGAMYLANYDTDLSIFSNDAYMYIEDIIKRTTNI